MSAQKTAGSSSRRLSAGRRAGSPYLILTLGLAATVGVTHAFREATEERDVGRFQNAVQGTHDRIQNRLDTYLAVLTAARGLFASRESVTAAEFREFVDQLGLAERYPGMQGVGFSRHIAPTERDELERAMQGQGREGFRVWPGHPRDEIHSVVLLEPLDVHNQAALGHDMYTEPVRREAMVRARDTGLPAASGRVPLVQDVGEQSGFFVYLPVYRRGVEPTTVEERRASLIGFVFSPFRMDHLLAGIFGSEREPRVSFTVHDGPLPRASALLYDSGLLEPDAESRFGVTEHLPIAGRIWRLTYRSLPAFESGSGGRLVPYILFLGVLVTGVLFLVSRGQARAHEKLREHAGVLAAMTDERSVLLAREQAARADAEAASRAKDEFLAMLGHELRNPLAPIVTAIELIKLRAGGSLDREHQVVERQVDHVVRLVDDLLDVSRITRGKISLRKQPLKVDGVVAKAVEMASPVLEEHRHHLVLMVPEGSLWITGDETRMAQVVANLLSNAAKYTEPGGRIELEAYRDAGDVVVRVSDNGMGIAPEMLPRVFDLFTQSQRGIDRSQGGLGLGLTVVKRLVEAHGGEVTAESEGIGRGSRFTVRLRALPEPPERDAVVRDPGAGQSARRTGARRVLVVDDNKDAAELLGELLVSAGHEVLVAHDGPMALEMSAMFRPEVAVLDIGLPVMDGYELAGRLRERGVLRLFAVTGYGQDHDRTRSREAGFELHLVKPIDTAALLDAVGARDS